MLEVDIFFSISSSAPSILSSFRLLPRLLCPPSCPVQYSKKQHTWQYFVILRASDKMSSFRVASKEMHFLLPSCLSQAVPRHEPCPGPPVGRLMKKLKVFVCDFSCSNGKTKFSKMFSCFWHSLCDHVLLLFSIKLDLEFRIWRRKLRTPPPSSPC